MEHARWFPHCPYVRLIKGEDFIELVRLSAELNQLEAVNVYINLFIFQGDWTHLAEFLLLSHCNREVVTSIPGRFIPKTLKLELATLALGSQKNDSRARICQRGVSVM